VGEEMQTNRMFFVSDHLVEKEVDVICDYVDRTGLDCEEWEVDRTNLVVCPVTDCVINGV
jgi:hypothetical protein